MSLRISDDVFAEQMITRFGLTWTIEDIPMDQIDWKTSATNHARLDKPIDMEHVSDLFGAVKRGDALPRIVLLRRKGKGFVIQAGNHRALARKYAGENIISAYVIESEDDLVHTSFPCALNAPMRQVSRADRITHALHAVSKGMEIEKAAEVFGIPAGTIKFRKSVGEFRQKMAKIGVSTSRLNDSVAARLMVIKNPNVAAPAIRLADRIRMTEGDVALLTKKLREAETETGMIAVIDSEEKSHPPSSQVNGGSQKQTLATKVITQAKRLETVLMGVASINQLGITDKEAKDVAIKQLRKLIERLSDICKRSR